MTLPFVLIDFENVQPKVLERLRPRSERVKVFLGQNQSKLMLDLVQALQPFGRDAEYIQIQGSGPDAVDFHIAFYIGQLAAAEPAASFTIVSKDKGFDPLIRHLALRRIDCRRLPELPPPADAEPANIPSVVAAAAKAKAIKSPQNAVTAKVSARITSISTTRSLAKGVIDTLKKSTKPAKLSTLRSSIKAMKPALDDKAIDAILQSLQDSKKISVSGTKVVYALDWQSFQPQGSDHHFRKHDLTPVLPMTSVFQAPPPAVNPRINLILRITVLWCLGVAGFHQLTVWAAPAHDEAAIFVGLLLTSFGAAAAHFAMTLVVIPLAVLRMLGRLFRGRKPMVANARGRDPLEPLGRIVFAAGFMALCAVVGACAGFVAGGHGIIASSAAFAAFGALLAILAPADVVFADDDDAGGTITDAHHADHEAARQAGVPAVLFVDRVVKGLREQLFEDQQKP